MDSFSSWDDESAYYEDDFSVTSMEEDTDKTETDGDESIELLQSSTVVAAARIIDDDSSTISTSTTATLPSTTVVFTIGDQVKVDDLLFGFITDLNMELDPPEAAVRHTIGGRVEDGIEFH